MLVEIRDGLFPVSAGKLQRQFQRFQFQILGLHITLQYGALRYSGFQLLLNPGQIIAGNTEFRERNRNLAVLTTGDDFLIQKIIGDGLNQFRTFLCRKTGQRMAHKGNICRDHTGFQTERLRRFLIFIQQAVFCGNAVFMIQIRIRFSGVWFIRIFFQCFRSRLSSGSGR